MVESIEQNQKKTTNIQDLISNREERHLKIQLWSNPYESEYAFRLVIAAIDDYSEDLFLAKTDPNANRQYFTIFLKNVLARKSVDLQLCGSGGCGCWMWRA